MIQNYFKILFRNFRSQKFFSILNLLGLTVGMAACMVIGLYVSYERSYDTFQPDVENVYRIRLDNYQNDGQLAWKSATSYPAIGPTMKKDYPEVTEFMRLYDANQTVITYKDKHFRETNYYFADPNALTFLKISMLRGNAKTALTGINKVVLSESTAKKYFGNEDAYGKMVKLDNDAYLVTGIFKDYAKNSHIELDFICSYLTSPDAQTNWGWYDFFTYVKLKPQTDPKLLEAKLPAMMMKYNGDWYRKSGKKDVLSLQPLQSIHLDSHLNQEAEVNGNGRTVDFMVWVALAILAIAWINYINLATSRALDRAKEVGIRKVVGAQRQSLVYQFVFESLFLNLIALVLAVVVVMLCLPFFNQLTGKPLAFIQLFDNHLWLVGIVIFVVGTLLSSLYPALILSNFQPIAILKGRYSNTTDGAMLRQGLIVVQFAASVILIIGTLTVYKQLQFMQNHDLGFSKEQTLVLRGPSVVDSTARTRSETFKQTILNQNLAKKVSASAYVPGIEILWTNSVRRKDQLDASNNVTMFFNAIDPNFLDTYSIPLLAGRNFGASFGMDSTAVLINETAMKVLGYKTPEEALNKELSAPWDGNRIIGVVRDYHQQALKMPKDPMIFILYPRANYYSLKVKSEDMDKTVEAVQKQFASLFPGNPFEYFFLDEFYNKQYQNEQQFGTVFGIFAGLAIFIASLGLLGLISFTVTRRTREIGIRKVLGASVVSITALLSKDFLKLVAISILIAVPAAWYVMNQWLDEFAYRTTIGIGVFILAGTLSIAIALLTVSYESIKAAMVNPVKSLKTE